MPRKTKQQPLLEGDIQQVDEKLLALLQRLGITALPPHETMLLPLERMVVPGAALLTRSAARLVKSIQKVGLLQAPALVLRSGTIPHDPQATFEVVLGRRRILAARMAGLSVVKCEVYASGTPQLGALLGLIENEQLSERLKIARLPGPILTQLFAGKVSQEVAKRIARLTPAHQEQVAELAREGADLTAALVTRVLRIQINTGLVPVQTALAQAWAQAPEPHAQPM